MKIGDIEIKNTTFLAPMAGITDMPFRVICKKYDCGLTYTEMISAKGLFFNDKKTKELLIRGSIEKPFAIQLFGSDADIIGEVVKNLESIEYDILDINMGCPTPKIVKNGDGCSLMKNPILASKIIKSAVANTKRPVTVKIRKGWDKDTVNAVEFAKVIQDSGAKAVTVHGRTREQYYSGHADWDIIKEVKKVLKIPVIGNGDIVSPIDAKNMYEYTGCDAIMIGRGARGNPWIFKSINNYLLGESVKEVNLKERFDVILEHFDLMIKLKGENIAVKEMRKHISWYIKGLKNSNTIKEQINKLHSFDEIRQLLFEYIEIV